MLCVMLFCFHWELRAVLCWSSGPLRRKYSSHERSEKKRALLTSSFLAVFVLASPFAFKIVCGLLEVSVGAEYSRGCSVGLNNRTKSDVEVFILQFLLMIPF